MRRKKDWFPGQVRQIAGFRAGRDLGSRVGMQNSIALKHVH
jgi:hypothetical protein